MAVHDGAGLIDVSTLGKLIVRGPEAEPVPQPALPEPVRQPEAGPDPLRGCSATTPGRIADDGTICRLDDPVLLRHDHVQWRRRRRGLVRLVARRMGTGTFTSPTSARASRRSNLAGPRSREIPLRAHRPGLLQRRLLLFGREASSRGRGPLPPAADWVRGRAGIRAPLPRRARGGSLGRPDPGR